MARPQRSRRICALPLHLCFRPSPLTNTEEILLSLDEYETLRLMDHEGFTHEQCALHMRISRTTASEIYAAARRKIAAALVRGCELRISGGSVYLCEHSAQCHGICPDCLDKEHGNS